MQLCPLTPPGSKNELESLLSSLFYTTGSFLFIRIIHLLIKPRAHVLFTEASPNPEEAYWELGWGAGEDRMRMGLREKAQGKTGIGLYNTSINSTNWKTKKQERVVLF